MKKSDLLENLDLASRYIPDDAEIGLVCIKYSGVELYTEFTPADAVDTDTNGDYIVSEAYEIQFVRQH